MKIGLPWIEKYRPATLKEIIGQEEITKRIQSYVSKESLPNLLFTGPAGVGKTSTAVAIAREFFGESFERNFLELNASVAPETPILIKEKGKVKRVNFEYLAKSYFKNKKGKYSYPKNLEVLSIDRNFKVKFSKASNISRHKVRKVAKIKYEGGEIRTSLNHSVIVFDSEGNLASVKAENLKKGDLLISFLNDLPGKDVKLNLSDFQPKLFNELRSGKIRNPKIKTVLDDMPLSEDLSWLFGLYLAEGCTSYSKSGTSGVTIFTVGYPQEEQVAVQAGNIIKDNFGLSPYMFTSASGFDRSRFSSMQVRTLNSQLSRFFDYSFYDGSVIRNAHTKRIPLFVFESEKNQRVSFMKGYMGDACGDWDNLVRYSSRSQNALIDLGWLARISGFDSSVFNGEARIVWKLDSYSYIKSGLLPAEPFIKKLYSKGGKAQNFLRHSLYGKKSKRVSKDSLKKFITENNYEKDIDFKQLMKIIDSPVFSVLIKDIEIQDYKGYVYDVAVPGTEMFWGGTTPVLLHNSDDRGIDVVRQQIKEFARTLALNAKFKIIFLDESDALTADAQQALRRTMEKYTKTTRFILSANYSSKLIEPIQSRCVIFRFRNLTNEKVKEKLSEVIEKEKIDIDEKAVDAIIYVAQGDVRKAINVLQASSSLDEKINEKAIYSVASSAKPEQVKEMIDFALKGEFIKARDLLDQLIYEYGMSGEDVIMQVHRAVMDSENKIPDKKKIDLLDIIGEYNFRIVEGANERIQLEAMLAQFMKKE